MNKIWLVSLFAVPVIAFTADHALHWTGGGGDKEKKAQSTETSQAQQAEAPARIGSLTGVRSIREMDTETRAKVKAEIKDIKENLETFDFMEEYQSGTFVYMNSNDVPKGLAEFLEGAVYDELITTNVMEIDLERQFSRCASGYRYTIVRADGFETHGEGFLVADVGCWDRPVGKFQYDLKNQIVGVHLNDELGSIPLREYLNIMRES